MFNKSIAYRLSIYISLAVIAIFIAFITFFYFFNLSVVKENATNQAKSNSLSVIMHIEKLIISTREISSNISDQAVYYEKNGDTEMFVTSLLSKYPFLNAIHIDFDTTFNTEQNNHYFFLQGDDSIMVTRSDDYIYHCKEEKEIFNQLSDKQSPNWSLPYNCEQSNLTIVSFYHPIFLRNSKEKPLKVGSLVCELSLLQLNDSINSIDIPGSGFAFLVDQNGNYITHPKKEWILNRNLSELSEKIYDRSQADPKELIKGKKSGWVVAYPEILDYKKTMVYYTPVNETNWSLIYAIPYYSMFESLYLALLRVLFVSVVGMLIIYLIVTYITNKLIEPLSNVTDKLKNFSRLSGEKDIKTLNEVRQVSESLKYLQTWYKNYQSSLNIEKQRSNLRKQDLMQASEIQHSLIKADFPAFPERKDVNLAAIYNPAKIVSGDLYDFFFIDDEKLMLTIGDVSGKGIPAAIFMSVSQTILKGNANFKMARTIVNKANKELHTNNQHQFFLTLFLGVFNVSTGTLYYCNAAHTPAIVVKKSGEILELKESHGLPLGIYSDNEYSDSKITLEKGDALVLYTDGVIELQNDKGEHYGAERFKNKLQQIRTHDPEAMVFEIEKDLMEFNKNALQNDDISILLLKYFR